MLSCAMKRASLWSGLFRWKAPGKHSNKASHWKASRAAQSSAWEFIRGATANRPETAAIQEYSSVRKGACLNPECTATRLRAPRASDRACCRKKLIRHPTDGRRASEKCGRPAPPSPQKFDIKRG